MKKTYGTSDEKFVKAITVFANPSKVLFADKDCSVEVNADEVVDAFNKNMLIIIDTDAFKPVSMNVSTKSFSCVGSAGSVVVYTCE